MKAPRQGGWAVRAAISATLFFIAGSPLFAQANPSPMPSALGVALVKTRTDGVATIAVYTASSHPESVRIWNSFYEGAWARTNRGLVQLVNVSSDTEPGLVRTAGVTRFPSAVVYVRSTKGVSHLATIMDFGTADSLVSRLRELDLGLQTVTKRDMAVKQIGLGGDVYPSQQYAPPACSWPQVQMCPPTQPQAQPTTLTLSPSVQPTLTTSAGVVQVPGQNLMIQQAPPQVFLAPTQAPIVYVPQTMSVASAAPSLNLSPAPVANAPAGNLFLTTPSLSASPAPQPTLALAVSAPSAAPAPAATLAVASGPPAPLAAVSNQTLSLPTSGSRTRVRVRGPGMLGASLARFGERLTQLGRARIETVQETTLEAPVNQAPSVGLATISTTSTTPLAQGPTMTLSPPQQQRPPCQTSCPAPPSFPPPSLPSPQK
jgi:hypothetical protein